MKPYEKMYCVVFVGCEHRLRRSPGASHLQVSPQGWSCSRAWPRSSSSRWSSAGSGWRTSRCWWRSSRSSWPPGPWWPCWSPDHTRIGSGSSRYKRPQWLRRRNSEHGEKYQISLNNHNNVWHVLLISDKRVSIVLRNNSSVHSKSELDWLFS